MIGDIHTKAGLNHECNGFATQMEPKKPVHRFKVQNIDEEGHITYSESPSSGIEISIHKRCLPMSQTQPVNQNGVQSGIDLEACKKAPKCFNKFLNESKFYVRLRNSFLVSANPRLFTKLMKYQVGGFEAERHRHLGTFPETIHPFGDFRWNWDIFMTLVLILTLVSLPLQIAFYSASISELKSIGLNSLAGLIFMIDIYLNFRTGFIGKDSDAVVLDSRITAMHYLKTWFVVDLVSTIPFDLLYLAIDDLVEGNEHTYFKYFRLLELLKVLRLARVVRYLTKLENAYDIKPVHGRIINLVTMMFFVIHWLGCMHYLVADFAHGHEETRSESWVTKMDLWDSPVWEKYIHCALRALSNMGCLGYGFENPRAPEDVICTLVSILIGATWFALFIANISNLVLSLDASHKKYDETLGHIMDYMKFKHMPRELQDRVEFYFEQRYRHNLFNEEEILGNLSSVLRSQLQMFNCQRLVQQVPILKGVRTEIIQEIVSALKAEVYLPLDVILWEDTVGDSMYFIQRGTVDVLASSGKVITQLHDGNFFGEMALLTNDQRRVATVVATSHCDLYSLKRQDFERVVRMYPEVFEPVLVVAQDRARRTTEEQKSCIQSSDETVRKEEERPVRRSLQELVDVFKQAEIKANHEQLVKNRLEVAPTRDSRTGSEVEGIDQFLLEMQARPSAPTGPRPSKPRPVRVSIEEIIKKNAEFRNQLRRTASTSSLISLERRGRNRERPVRSSLQEILQLDLSHLRKQDEDESMPWKG